ncbi:hypothetical protein [Telmatospirillum siberiense]|uniref:hypothetical protein n=1 Tax=Telmatospirillum siberiense TaxID=382514 RepID=UPI0011AF50EE|nr:hypothetical protein [Telmatospirillum siberiense]
MSMLLLPSNHRLRQLLNHCQQKKRRRRIGKIAQYQECAVTKWREVMKNISLKTIFVSIAIALLVAACTSNTGGGKDFFANYSYSWDR